MNSPHAIPPEYRTLIACLRGAVNGTPPDKDLASADWPVVFRQAQEQGVDTYLYPWLAKYAPDLFSNRATVAADSTPAVWRSRFFMALPFSTRRKNQLTALLAACANAHIDVIPLKGAWLSEAVYGDPAQRSMSDLDLLVRAEDRDACHALFLSLGYSAKADVLHSAFASDQTYRHPGYPLCVELHWHVEPERVNGTPLPDIAAIWENTSEALFHGYPVRLLAPADQVSHLTQHILHHLFAMPLRGYLDIALYLQTFGARLTGEALEASAGRWKTGRATPFVLRLVADLFALPLPETLRPYCPTADTERLAQAFAVIFDLPTVRERDGETTLLRFKRASAAGRVRLVLSRIFIPRAQLLLHYPCARHTCLLPYAWLCRARDLRQKNSHKVRALLSPGAEAAYTLENTERRADLVNWLLSPP